MSNINKKFDYFQQILDFKFIQEGRKPDHEILKYNDQGICETTSSENSGVLEIEFTKFLYREYVVPFGMQFIESQIELISDETVQAWLILGVQRIPTLIQYCNEEFDKKLNQLLDRIDKSHLEKDLLEIFRPYKPFVTPQDYLEFGRKNLDTPYFCFFFLLIIIAYEDLFPIDRREGLPTSYNECTNSKCRLQEECSNQKRCLIIEKFFGAGYNFEYQFIKFQRSIISDYLISVLPNDREKALAKLDDVFAKINQTNLFEHKLSMGFLSNEKPQTGVFSISWNQVDFHDEYYVIRHPNVPFNKAVPLKISDPSSRKIFKNISKLFLDKLEPLYVEARNGKIIKILNITELNKCIKLMEYQVAIPDVKKKDNDKEQKMEKKELSVIEAQEICKKIKSLFLNYLCSKQLDNYKVICCIEQRINATQVLASEYSFIFTVKEENNMLYLAYENSSDSRCTYVFPIPKESWEESINCLYDFFASNIVNKRQLLALRKVDLQLPGNHEYHRVFHSDFASWVERINI